MSNDLLEQLKRLYPYMLEQLKQDKDIVIKYNRQKNEYKIQTQEIKKLNINI